MFRIEKGKRAKKRVVVGKGKTEKRLEALERAEKNRNPDFEPGRLEQSGKE